LLGVPPIEAIIDLKYLSLFGSIIRRRGSKIYNLARRQLVMKDVYSYSWFSKITVLIYKYGLPSPHDVITLEPTKNRWKNMCHAAVYKHWSRILQEKSQEKSTLRYTKLPNLEDKKPHLLWRATHSNPRDIRRACIKSKIATGTYLLQANANIWSRNKDSQLCPLCKEQSENREHFLLLCSILEPIRTKHREALQRLLQSIDIKWQNIQIPQDLQLQMLLDCSHDNLKAYIELSEEQMMKIEIISRNWCYALHYKRASLLDYRA
jgi:hypothetical protein